MDRDDVKKAADCLGRLEALEAALRSVNFAPHQAFPVSFFDKGEDDDHQNDHGIKAFYPRDLYIDLLHSLIAAEEYSLVSMGIEL